MGSVGGITGSQLRPQAEARAAQPKIGALAYVDPGASAGSLDEDILASTVMEVGSSAETAPEHENPAAPLQQQAWAPFAAAYAAPLEQAVNTGGVKSRTGASPSQPVRPDKQAAGVPAVSERAARGVRLAFRWAIIVLIAIAAVEAFLLLTAAPPVR